MSENTPERLDSPLVVHKESDASYQENASEISMNATHTDDEGEEVPTLERHRFKKTKKKGKTPVVILVIILVIAAVLFGMYYTDKLPFMHEKTTEQTTRKSYTTSVTNDFEGVIVIKGTYIFFEGEEINGIQDLEKKVKYLDAGTTFAVKDEHADSSYLNDYVLPLLSKYGISYEITHIESSGLVSQFETTAATTTAATTTTVASTQEAE